MMFHKSFRGVMGWAGSEVSQRMSARKRVSRQRTRKLRRRRPLMERLEDRCLLAVDFGDAPDPSYPTLFVNDGARHVIVSGIYLGDSVDAETDGQPDAFAEGDDVADSGTIEDDEDGIFLDGVVSPGGSAQLEITASTAGYIHAWLDVDQSGSWDTGEKLLDVVPVAAGLNTLPLTFPGGMATGLTYARFRFVSSAGALGPTGEAADGEVEDYPVTVLASGTATVKGQKFLDLNDDGVRQADEPGMDGVVIELIDPELGYAVAATKTHSEDLNQDEVINPATETGLYSFTGLPAGVYELDEVIDRLEQPVDRGLFPNQDSYVFALAPGETLGQWPSEATTACGPGAGWVNTCTTGEDQFTATAQVTLGLLSDPAGTSRVYDLTGTVTVSRGDPAGFNPTIDTEIVSMELNGWDNEWGQVTMKVSAAQPSTGRIKAWTPAEEWADSFFDVFLEFNWETTQSPLHNEEAIRLETSVDRFVPWYETYENWSWPAPKLIDSVSIVRAEVMEFNLTPHVGLDFGNTLAWDFGDAPDGLYPTLIQSDGARHYIDPGFHLGATVDAELDGQPNPMATGDDRDGNGDDEDGVVIAGRLIPGQNVPIDVQVTGSSGFLDAWFDWDQNGSWLDAGEHVLDGLAVSPGNNTFTVSVPNGAVLGSTYARFRLSGQQDLGPDGPAESGEVEDYRVIVEAEATVSDFGDAEDPGYPTLLASGGARHLSGSLMYLGGLVDTEPDGQPTTGADGDDVNTDDEDGVVFTSILAAGELATINVTASSPGYLNAWFDWGQDGDWGNVGDQVFADQPLTTGLNSLSFMVSSLTEHTPTTARFRFSSEMGISFDGPSLDGEVEDYVVDVVQVDWADAPTPYPTLRVDDGARHILSSDLRLGKLADGDDDGYPDYYAEGDDWDEYKNDEDGVYFEGLLSAGRSVDIVVTSSGIGIVEAWLDLNRDGVWDSPGERILNNAVTEGVNTFPFTLPVDISPGSTYARFRLSSAGGLSPGGLASDGEVEDYRVHLLLAGEANVYGQKFLDKDEDGFRDPDEPGVDGVAIQLADVDQDYGIAGVVRTRSVDRNEDGKIDPYTEQGLYVFEGLPSGNYAIWEQLEWNVDPLEQGSVPLDGWYPFALATGQTLGGWPGGLVAACGPGYGWVADCPAGQDTLTARVTASIELPNPDTGQFDGTESLFIELTGNIVLQRGAASLEGFHSSVVTEIVDWTVTGRAYSYNDETFEEKEYAIFLRAGDGVGNLEHDGSLFSPGGFGELLPGDEIAESFFDVFFEVDVPDAGIALHNTDSLPLLASIEQYPAYYTPYIGDLAEPLALYNAQEEIAGQIDSFQLVVQPGLDFGNIAAYDWGDAPDGSYPTSFASDGARHDVTPGFSLGERVDVDPDGQPNSSATGDDLDGSGDDEDGVVFASSLLPGSPASLQVTVSDNSSSSRYLDAWFDWNGNGSWLDAGEHVLVSQSVSVGLNPISVPLPQDAQVGMTYARFRLSREQGLTPQGIANAGEVEDYRILIEAPEQTWDFGDAPDPTFPTLLASYGARHLIGGPLFLGTAIDPDGDGQPVATADGDDNNGSDDEDGVVFASPLVTGQSADVKVTASADGLLNAWIDLDADGDWSDSGEHVFVDEPLSTGLNDLQLDVAAWAVTGQPLIARFRVSTDAGLSFDGPALDGEVEDYSVEIIGVDWGDVPPSLYPTMRAQDGAAHILDGTLFLGALVDAESDAQPLYPAVGDDIVGAADDDGVAFPKPLAPGYTAVADVTASAAGLLNAWIDLNSDGDWDDAGEQIAVDKPMSPGVNHVSFTIPETAVPDELTFARFRISSQAGLGYSGTAPDGEVEDYALVFEAISWQNTPWWDVNDDGAADPDAGDVLALVNDLNINGARALPMPPLPPDAPPPYLDPSGDTMITPKDVLIVINYINGLPVSASGATLPSVGEGEGLPSGVLSARTIIVGIPSANGRANAEARNPTNESDDEPERAFLFASETMRLWQSGPANQGEDPFSWPVTPEDDNDQLLDILCDIAPDIAEAWE